MNHVLSFENVAMRVAEILRKEGEGPAEEAAARFERNIAWDRRKLFQRAQELVEANLA